MHQSNAYEEQSARITVWFIASFSGWLHGRILEVHTPASGVHPAQRRAAPPQLQMLLGALLASA